MAISFKKNDKIIFCLRNVFPARKNAVPATNLQPARQSDIPKSMPKKTDEFIPTRESLLLRLKDWEDRDSWQEFFSTYRKLIFSTALKSGLSETEAEEVLQETIISVAKTIKEFKYDRKRCTFKSWLGHLTRKRIADQFRKRSPRHAEPPPHSAASDTPKTPFIERVPDPSNVSLEALWEQEWKEKLLETAIAQVKREVSARQYQIFDFYTLRKMSVSEVAASLGVSAGQVYLAKHRVARLIKKAARRLEAQMSRGIKHGN
jgi:RNA polymerase sigma factor (sigma-70 family)